MIETVQYHTAFTAGTVLLAGVSCSLVTTGLFSAAANDEKPMPARHSYEDDRLRVQLPAGWVAKQATATVTGDHTYQTPVGGVLSKGRYRIYLLTHEGQASGINGGRFGEISQYVSPWMRVGDPWGCIDNFGKVVTPVVPHVSRVDLFLDSNLMNEEKDSDCRNLHSPARVPIWFGSYFGKPDPGLGYPGFFLTFPLSKSDIESSDEQMVFTATIDTKDPETLPAKGDRELNEFLREASAIVSSIRYK